MNLLFSRFQKIPTWHVNEIILLVIETLSEQEYYKEDFDYKKMISDMGIKLKKFSPFNPENTVFLICRVLICFPECPFLRN